jgi:hypothetical protein
MYSMWNAPSDRDYYEQYAEPEAEERCFDCGAGELQACEERCMTNQSAEEPQPDYPPDWTRLGLELREAALDAHDGELPAVEISVCSLHTYLYIIS